MLTNFTDPFKHIQSIADSIRRDVENSLNRTFETWDVLEHSLPNDQDSYYRMKIRTDNNGHVKVKTIEKEPGKDWNINIEEYDRGKAIKAESPKTIESDKSNKMIKADTSNRSPKDDKPKVSNKVISSTKSGNRNAAHGRELATVDKSHGNKIQSIADLIKKDVETMLNETFNMFDVFEHTSSSNKENQNYNMKIRTDNEGSNVRVNAAPRKSGKGWDVHVQENNKSKTAKSELQENTKNDKVDIPKKTGSMSKANTRLATLDKELADLDRSITNEIQSIANFLKNDVESIMNETFKMFDVFEHTTTSSNKEKPNYNMKIRTDDKDGNIQVNATPQESGKDWDVHVQQSNKGKDTKESPRNVNANQEGPRKMNVNQETKSMKQATAGEA